MTFFEANSSEKSSLAKEPGAFSGMNPFIVTLAWLWSVSLVIAGTVALIASQATFPDSTAVTQFMWASIFGAFGLSALLTCLLANALLWKPPVSG